jgi:hypothetical protein
VVVDQRKFGAVDGRWVSLGVFRFAPVRPGRVVVDAAGLDGLAHIDAVQVLPAK